MSTFAVAPPITTRKNVPEQQIGIYVFGRTPGYNTTEDNIVRSHARLLRLKLEHHFNHEGKDEPVVITIPKGRYLQAFEKRFEQSGTLAEEFALNPGIKRRGRLLVASIVMFGLTIALVASLLYRSKVLSSISWLVALPATGRRLTSWRLTDSSPRRLLAKSVSPPVIRGLHTWTCGGTVGKPTVTTRVAFSRLAPTTFSLL